ncbi:MAG TPA: hypothetical protein VF401_00575 [Candidatus Saccharimonadales bacterium]
MKEFAPPAFETQEARHTPERHEVKVTTPEKAEHSPKNEIDPRQALQEARKAVNETNQSDTQLNALKELQEAENAPQMATPHIIDKNLRKISYNRTKKNIQRQLPVQERLLSKVIHQPVVRVVSETAGKTVSRPSGLLGGGLVALIGTSGYLYLAKHLGFRYNYLVFLVLFASGFILGLILEFVVWVATAGRRKHPQ